MYWGYVKTDPKWLKTRKGHITASRIAEIFSKSKNPRKDTIDNHLKEIWWENNSNFPLEETAPSQAASRGHIMEPFAVLEYNNINDEQFYHVDNLFISSGLFGFSPDAINVPMEVVAKDPSKLTRVLEVKCYGSQNHMNAWLDDKSARKERWQIATAMKTVPSIEKGTVMWYSPNAVVPIILKDYTRDELAEELEKLDELAERYEELAEELHILADSSVVTNDLLFTEEFINKEACVD